MFWNKKVFVITFQFRKWWSMMESTSILLTPYSFLCWFHLQLLHMQKMSMLATELLFQYWIFVLTWLSVKCLEKWTYFSLKFVKKLICNFAPLGYARNWVFMQWVTIASAFDYMYSLISKCPFWGYNLDIKSTIWVPILFYIGKKFEA